LFFHFCFHLNQFERKPPKKSLVGDDARKYFFDQYKSLPFNLLLNPIPTPIDAMTAEMQRSKMASEADKGSSSRNTTDVYS